MATKAKTSRKPHNDQVFAALVNPATGQTALIESGTELFDKITMSLLAPGFALDHASGSHGSRRLDAVPSSPFQRGTGRLNVSAYQFLTGTVLPSLRQRLLPRDDDLTEIVQRIDFYRKHVPWVNRGLVRWAGLNAAEFRVDAPAPQSNKAAQEQQKWMTELKRRFRMFSYMREFFWCLRGFGQTVTIWRTAQGGRDPVSIECASLQVYQPRFDPADGSRPRIVAIPANDDVLHHLANEARGADSARRARAQERLNAYPAPIRDAVMDVQSTGAKAEVEDRDLEPFGFHFEYATLDRRHWEDWGFPGMFSIFPYLEMLMLADDADINALHHYKAGILLVRLGPSEPRAGDEALIAGEPELKAIDKKLAEMVKARLPAWAARGDLRIDWVVPPEHIMNPSKVASAKEKVLDWIGLPRIAWPGQDIQGSFASWQAALKFLQQDSKDERGIAKEQFERLFTEWSESSNRFKGAVQAIVRFDPNALLDAGTILKQQQLYQQYGGADMQTIAEMADYDAEVWLSRHAEMDELKKKYKTDFDPEFVPQSGSRTGSPPGRPTTANQPTPERDGDQQPRPSTTVDRAAEVAERQFGVAADEFRRALEAEIVTAE